MGRLTGPKSLFDQREVLIPLMDKLGPCYGLWQVGLQHITAVQPCGLSLGFRMDPESYRALLDFPREPSGDFHAGEFRLALPEGDVHPGARIRRTIRIFLCHPRLQGALLISPHCGHLRSAEGIPPDDIAEPLMLHSTHLRSKQG